jgi:hypothetical protein
MNSSSRSFFDRIFKREKKKKSSSSLAETGVDSAKYLENNCSNNSDKKINTSGRKSDVLSDNPKSKFEVKNLSTNDLSTSKSKSNNNNNNNQLPISIRNKNLSKLYSSNSI